MFAEALQQLVSDTGADLAIFCDYDGESIAHASRGLDDFDVRVAGAQLASAVLTLQRLIRRGGNSERASVQIGSDPLNLLLECLPGGYYLLLGLRDSSRIPFARFRMRQVAQRFLLEL